MRLRHLLPRALCVAACTVFVTAISLASAADNGRGKLLFSLSGQQTLKADYARGIAQPNFAAGAEIARDKSGTYLKAGDKVTLAWHASGNIYAERGTLSFDWRARTPPGAQPFPIFRVSFADHSSWDMVWLRIDWNGHGFDGFVTDTSLRRIRVSWRMKHIPAPDQWLHIAFGWDERRGVVLYVNGEKVAEKKQPADLDAGLDQFGLGARIISPMQVQSNFQFERGSDFKNIRILDHMPGLPFGESDAEWRHRFGWDKQMPAGLKNKETIIRKVAFKTAIDVKERMMAGCDGIDETTWPGVYNRSRLAGRHDYFELPDWNVYAEGSRSVGFVLSNETFNHIEFLGAAHGRISWSEGGQKKLLADRAAGTLRSAYDFSPRQGGVLHFRNDVPETPIREFQAYDIHAGSAPENALTLSYQVTPGANLKNYPAADEVRKFVRGRFLPGEATLVAALPQGAPLVKRDVPKAASPVLNIVIPGNLRQRFATKPDRFHYGWNEMRAGLDGVVLHLPALRVKPLRNGLYPINIQLMDPIWPARKLMDVSVSVKPGAAHTIFLDTRDRFLPKNGALYLKLSGGGAGLNAAALSGMKIDLKFKPRAAALPEHVADRLAEIRDNAAFIVEEYTGDRRFARAERLAREFAALFAADPDNRIGRQYYAWFHPAQPWPEMAPLPPAPKGVPAWAYLQTEDLKLVDHFVSWWIDHRQSAYGDFGGGISDDDDLTHQWPPLALMGVKPDKIRASLSALAGAVDKNHMITHGLGTIETDYLHSYEEGINARSDDLYLNWGSPRVLERLMQTARAYPRIIKPGKDGHQHIISQLYSGSHVVTEGRWGVAHPYSYLILHPAYDIAGYNGNPAMVKLIRDLADGYLAAGVRDPAGRLRLPEMINGHTGKHRGWLTPTTRGLAGPVNLLLAAGRFSAETRYLEPLKDLIDRQPYPVLKLINGEAAADHPGWLARLAGDAALAESRDSHVLAWQSLRGRRLAQTSFDRFYAWRQSGDKKWLARLYRDEIGYARQMMFMATGGEWWTDRVEIPSDMLQRARLGGLALRRNQELPGQLVSWRFARPGDAERVGLLIEHPSAESFAVEAYNLSDQTIRAKMTGWQVAPGVWQVSQVGAAERTFHFETSRAVTLSFPPHRRVMLQFRRIRAGDDPRLRPDVGIDRDDVVFTGGEVRVTVHGLGHRSSPAGVVVLRDGGGHVLARTSFPALRAPVDNHPVRTVVRLHNPGRVVRVELVLPAPEVTQQNNKISLKRDSQNMKNMANM